MSESQTQNSESELEQTDEELTMYEMLFELEEGDSVLFEGDHDMAKRMTSKNKVVEVGEGVLFGTDGTQDSYHDEDENEIYVVVETPRGAHYRMSAPVEADEDDEEIHVTLEYDNPQYDWLGHYGPLTNLAVVADPEEISVDEIDGIGPKRAEQLEAAGIENVAELAKTSVSDIEDALNVSTELATKLSDLAIEMAEQQ